LQKPVGGSALSFPFNSADLVRPFISSDIDFSDLNERHRLRGRSSELTIVRRHWKKPSRIGGRLVVGFSCKGWSNRIGHRALKRELNQFFS
jgi:hypothetical protein